MKDNRSVTYAYTEPEIPGIIDVHAHILPGVDDGARSFKEALALLQMEYEQGVRAVIATPHYSRRGENQGLEDFAEELQKQVEELYPDFHIYLGHETYYHEELAERVRDGYARTMAGSRYLLVEFEPEVTYQTLFRGLRKLIGAGYIPILAHMERYVCLREKQRVEELISCGCFMQMNYESLEGHFFQSETRWCRRQVLNGRIHLLGSDMHRESFRPPRLTEAVHWLEKNLDEEVFELLTRKNPMHILNDEMLKEPGAS